MLSCIGSEAGAARQAQTGTPLHIGLLSGTTSVCIPDPEHLVYMFSMSGVAHQRLSQVSKIFLRLSRPVLHLPTASTSAAVGVLDAHAGTEAVAERPPLRLCG